MFSKFVKRVVNQRRRPGGGGGGRAKSPPPPEEVDEAELDVEVAGFRPSRPGSLMLNVWPSLSE